MEQLITMSNNELNRQNVMEKIKDKRLTQVKAAQMLNMSLRQVQRLYARYKKEGSSGLVSRKRGKTPNNVTPETIRLNILSIIKEKYHDFGPTFVAEKLFEVHNLHFAVETIRKWMIDAELWTTRKKRLKRAYQPRYRRECYGELIQIDGSRHHWFESRGEMCTLLVYIDDATGKLMECQFVMSESTFTYFDSTRRYIQAHGKPVAFYSDKHSTFRSTNKNSLRGDRVTQFSRALTDLNIDIICANSPQAKGRVERANRTLQDRLVKEMRLRKINSIEEGNLYLPYFIEDFNKRFGKIPPSDKNIHRELLEHENLEDIFCCQDERSLSNSLTLQYNRILYMLEDNEVTRPLARKRIKVHEYYDGHIEIFHNGTSLPYTIFEKQRRVAQGDIVNNKRLGAVLEFIKEKQSEYDEAIQPSTSCPSSMHRGGVSKATLRKNTSIKRPQKR